MTMYLEQLWYILVIKALSLNNPRRWKCFNIWQWNCIIEYGYFKCRWVRYKTQIYLIVRKKKKLSHLRLEKIEKSFSSYNALFDYMIRLYFLLKSGRMVINIPILRPLSTYRAHICKWHVSANNKWIYHLNKR